MTTQNPNPEKSTLEKEMPFLAHLTELRSRLIHITIGLSLCSILAYVESESIFKLLTNPLLAIFNDVELIGTGPSDAFMAKIKVAIAAGIVLSAPYTFFQIWKFISPALHESEKKLSFPFVIFSTFFFLAGVAFCYFAVLPFAFSFFLEEYKSISVAPKFRIDEYLSSTMKLLLIFGTVFELPMLSYFLGRLGIITHGWLIKKFRYAIVIIFIAAGVLTPQPDITSQLLLAFPLIFLYGLCIAITYYTGTTSKAKT